MIPLFEESGNLPPGVHPARMDEIEERFGRDSELRRVQMESIRWMVDLAMKAGVRRIVLNGSFVTDIIDPNDVDCLLLRGTPQLGSKAARRELRKGLPFLDITIARQEAFDEYTRQILP
ncbi:MAG: hypothetical protein IPK83_06370 [Planctomycetes bacterium]|nr:hypothetical protein [Planctomycetota bacterium]